MLVKYVKAHKLDDDALAMYAEANYEDQQIAKMGKTLPYVGEVYDLLAHIAYLQLELAKANVTISQIETALEQPETIMKEKGWVVKLRRIAAILANYRKEN